MPHRRSPEKLKQHRERWYNIVSYEQNRPRYTTASSFKAHNKTVSPYSDSGIIMKQLRNAIGVCQHCGSDSQLQVHHINHDHQNNRPENLLVLCRECHRKEHWS
jgi:5-methylcytosine-specific restriction endonuclease McrA